MEMSNNIKKTIFNLFDPEISSIQDYFNYENRQQKKFLNLTIKQRVTKSYKQRDLNDVSKWYKTGLSIGIYDQYDFDNQEVFEKIEKGLNNCKATFLHGKDDQENNYLMPISCNREYCPICGKKESKSHRRRYTKTAERLIGYKSLGYFVFTIPGNIRKKFRNKSYIRNTQRKIKELLKSYGFDKGYLRWHWFGDSDFDIPDTEENYIEEKQKAFEKMKYNPHLNIIIPGSRIKKEIIEEIRNILQKYFEYLGSNFSGKKYILHYSYTDSKKKMWHLIKYVTRSTFLYEHLKYNMDIAVNVLYGLKNNNPYGKLDKFNISDYVDSSYKQEKELQNKNINWNNDFITFKELFLYNPIKGKFEINQHIEIKLISKSYEEIKKEKEKKKQTDTLIKYFDLLKVAVPGKAV